LYYYNKSFQINGIICHVSFDNKSYLFMIVTIRWQDHSLSTYKGKNAAKYNKEG